MLVWSKGVRGKKGAARGHSTTTAESKVQKKDILELVRKTTERGNGGGFKKGYKPDGEEKRNIPSWFPRACGENPKGNS